MHILRDPHAQQGKLNTSPDFCPRLSHLGDSTFSASHLCPISPHVLSVPLPKDLLDPFSSLILSSGPMPSLPGRQLRPSSHVSSPHFSALRPGTFLNRTTYPASPVLETFPANSPSASSLLTLSRTSLEFVMNSPPKGGPLEAHSGRCQAPSPGRPQAPPPQATPPESKGC